MDGDADGGAGDADGIGDAGAPLRLRPDMASLRLLVLKVVRAYIGRHHGSPSYGEIAHALGISRMSAHKAVKSLVKDRLLLRTPGPRGLMLPDSRDDALRVLAALGYTIFASDSDVGRSTNPLLPPMAVLDYLPEPDGDADGEVGVGSEIAGNEGGERRQGAGEDRRRAQARPDDGGAAQDQR